MKKFYLSTGEKVTVRPCMIDLDGTNLEEGLSITVNDTCSNDTWSFEIMGYSENEITEDFVLELLDDYDNNM